MTTKEHTSGQRVTTACRDWSMSTETRLSRQLYLKCFPRNSHKTGHLLLRVISGDSSLYLQNAEQYLGSPLLLSKHLTECCLTCEHLANNYLCAYFDCQTPNYMKITPNYLPTSSEVVVKSLSKCIPSILPQ